MGLWWPPAASSNCAQVRHHSPAGTFTRVPGRCLRWSPTSQGPRWPPANICILIEVLHLYRCVTHTPCLWQGSATEDEVKMKMRGKWRWGDLEDEMKTYLTRTRRGERKRRRREHQHNTPGPERANPGEAREKKSGGSTDTEQDQRRGGGRKRLNQPDTAKTYKHLSTRRSQPTWGGKNAWDRGPMGISWWNHKKLKQDSVPNFLDVVRLFPAPGPWSSLAPIGIKQLSNSNELGAQNVHLTKKTIKRKKTIPGSRVPAWFLCHECREATQNAA